MKKARRAKPKAKVFVRGRVILPFKPTRFTVKQLEEAMKKLEEKKTGSEA